MTKLKDYVLEIKLEFSHFCEAESKKKAIELVKESFHEDYGIELADDEIVSINPR